jgi:short subunit fatty acids transporter
MFSKGQIIFGILFAITFIIVLIFAYRKDINIHKHYYKGTFWVLIAFIAFLLLIVGIKSLFTN